MERWILILRVKQLLSLIRQHDEGFKHGKGKFTWADGSTYDGNFNKNLMEGFGKIVWPDHKTY